MLQILLTLIAIGLVRCQLDTSMCPDFADYNNDVDSLDDLNGDYMVVYTTCNYTLNCERMRWTVGANNSRTAVMKDSSGCCRRIDNFDTSKPDYVTSVASPQTTCTRLPTTVNVASKVILATGNDENRCYVVYVCHEYRNGFLVVCRKQPGLLLWLTIRQLLASVLNLLGFKIPIFRSQNQSDCSLYNTCYV